MYTWCAPIVLISIGILLSTHKLAIDRFSGNIYSKSNAIPVEIPRPTRPFQYRVQANVNKLLGLALCNQRFGRIYTVPPSAFKQTARVLNHRHSHHCNLLCLTTVCGKLRRDHLLIVLTDSQLISSAIPLLTIILPECKRRITNKSDCEKLHTP